MYPVVLENGRCSENFSFFLPQLLDTSMSLVITINENISSAQTFYLTFYFQYF